MKLTRTALLAALVLVLGGCGFPELFEDQGTLQPPQTGINALEVETGNGFVQVTRVADSTGISIAYTRRAHGRSRADAEEHINDVVVSSYAEGGVLKVKAEWPEAARTYGCDFSIVMGMRIPVDLQTTNGPITLTGTEAPATLETTNGPIEVNGTSGATKARSTNGPVRFSGHRGPLEARTTNAPVTCGVSVLIPTDAVSLQSTNGAVTLTIPSDTQADFDATTTNGEVTVGGFPSVSYSITEREHKAGTINGGGADVTLSTTNARIDFNGE